MILLRLLTSGRSLMGLHDSRNRYRVLDRGLPKFAAKENPFRDHSAAEAGEAAAPQQGDGGEPSPGGWRRKLAAGVGSMLRRPAAPAKPEVKAAEKAPVQCELSLDQVKVIRNDLSDSDFEVVAKAKPRKSALPTAPPSPAVAPAEKTAAGPESAWERVSLRIFGAGKAS